MSRTEKPQRARLFFALDLPEPVRELIAAWQAGAAADPALRPVAAANLHITLAFLGWTPTERIDAAAEALAAVPARPIEATLRSEPVPVPERRPRLFALDAPSPAAVGLEAELSAALVERGLYKPEQRPFWPHLTVLRVGNAKRGSRKPARVERPPGPLPGDPDGHTFGSVRIALYRSDLRPEGAHYSRLAATDLPPPGGPNER